MKHHVVIHERSKPAPRGVTIVGDRISIIVGGDDREPVTRGDMDRVKVRTLSNRTGAHWQLDHVDFISGGVLSEFAHGILRTIGEET